MPKPCKTNHGCLHCAILKALHGFEEKKSPQGKRYAIILQIVQSEIFKIFKILKKNNMKFIRATC